MQRTRSFMGSLAAEINPKLVREWDQKYSRSAASSISSGTHQDFETQVGLVEPISKSVCLAGRVEPRAANRKD
jgi:hypothetical protein